MALVKQKTQTHKDTLKSKIKKRVLLATASLSMVVPAFAAIDPDVAARKALKVFFNILIIGGLAICAYGISLIGKAVNEGENAPPGALGKGIGALIGGLILCFAQVFVEKITGIDIETFSFFS